MPSPDDPFVCYLRAKRSVDDRALNQAVVDRVRAELADRSHPIRVLDLGAGSASMAVRALDWDVFSNADYVAVDDHAGAVADIRRGLPEMARSIGLAAETKEDGAVVLTSGDRRVSVTAIMSDVFSFVEGCHDRFDLIVGHHFIDLVDARSLLARLWPHMAAGGIFWLTLCFDGGTVFEPAALPEFEARIIAMYHRTMDDRVRNGKAAGDSHCGRHLFGHLAATGATLLAAGSSDSIVFPTNGSYPRDEAVFLHSILDTIETALSDKPALNQELLRQWLDLRRRQVDSGELVYMTHQLDFCGRVPAARPFD